MKNDRIRVGYISDNFCQSPMLPLIVSFFGMHDSEEFEIIGYMAGQADGLTKSFRETAEGWRDIRNCEVETAADFIRRDAPDILIDLSEDGAFEGVLKQKPAKHCLSVFDMAEKMGDIPYVMAVLPGIPIANTVPPFRGKDGVTFGLCRSPKEMTKDEISVVKAVLRHVPGAKLRVSVPVPDAALAEPLLSAGISAASIELAVEDAMNWEGLSAFDVLLAFGELCAWELYMALYAGVPVLLSPSSPVWMHRFLANQGFETWAASSYEAQAETAVRIARDRESLAKERIILRAKLQQTPAMDVRRFTSAWEKALEKIVRGEDSRAERLEFCKTNARKRFKGENFRAALRFAEEAYGIEQSEEMAYIIGVSLWKNERLQDALNIAAEWLEDEKRRNTLTAEQLYAWCDIRALTAGHAAHERTEEYLLKRIEAAKRLSVETQAGAYGQWLLSFNAKDIDEKELFQKHCGYQKLFEGISHLPPKTWKHEKLRIGYLSPNLNHHVMEYFIRPFFERFDRDRFEIYGYNTGKIDDRTKELQRHARGWKNLEGRSAEEIACAVRVDEIDILVELGGHTSKSGLAALAYRPAPVQISGLGYMATTGLLETDYFLTDSFIDPPGVNDSFFTEKFLRLTSQFCYQPKENLPECVGAPCMKRGYVTFGIFNDYLKITDDRLRIWKKIMEVVPDSVFLFKSESYTVPEMRLQAVTRMERLGINVGRVILEGASPDYMTRYLDVDIALDTYPYPGGATTCDALWMGVPVVTQYGTRHSSRFAYGILAEIGLSELGAETEDGYIERAVGLAGDTELLDALHKNLRIMMKKSPLMDKNRYIGEVETFYEKITK